eukprot:366007-Chlamydomonas_euryale.AAC.6
MSSPRGRTCLLLCSETGNAGRPRAVAAGSGAVRARALAPARTCPPAVWAWRRTCALCGTRHASATFSTSPLTCWLAAWRARGLTGSRPGGL